MSESESSVSDELTARRQRRCAEREQGHEFDRGTYGICTNCQLQVNPQRSPFHPSIKQRRRREKMGSHETHCPNCGYKWVTANDVMLECPRCQFVPVEDRDAR